MNYYPFHIGDYLSATRHLSWEEDAAFRRLLDTYYTTEKALPADDRAVCRLVLATTDSQREAVRVVLNEFFVLTPEGWVNHRADAEIGAMREKQAVNDVRDAHEKERMRRHRERRAEMFAALREHGVVPAWDVPIKELQRLYEEHCEKPATGLKREQVVSGNGPATAIPTPTPTPTCKSRVASQPRVNVDLPDWLPAQAWHDWHEFRNSRKGWTAKARNLSIATLARLRAKGHDPTAVIEQSIERGWTGLFPIHGDHDASSTRGGKLSPSERIARSIAEVERERRAPCGNVVEGEFALVQR